MALIQKIFFKLGYVPKDTTLIRTCAWCGKNFEWSGHSGTHQPSFCGRMHRKRASEARKKRKEANTSTAEKLPKRTTKKPPPAPSDMNMVGRCPHPFKINFQNVHDAELVIKKVDPTMHVYRCQCGGLHIGHRKKAKL